MNPDFDIRKLFFLAFPIFFTACNPTSDLANDSSPVSGDSALVTDLIAPLPSMLRESSGLCYTDGNLWTFGDSGNPNEIYRIDSATGKVLQTVGISNFSNTDWEDITADSLYIYVGDFGNNRGNRKDLKIIRIKKTDLVSAAMKISVTGDAIGFSYTDQTAYVATDSSNFDCESLLAFGDNLYIFSKDAVDLKTRCYKIPKTPGNYPVSPVATFDVQGRITAAAYNEATHELALLGYLDKAGDGNSFIWFFNSFSGDGFFSGTAKRYVVGSEKLVQTEGLDYISGNRLFMSCESDDFEVASLYLITKP